MHIEIQVALNFVISYLYNKLPRRRVNIFGEELEKALREKFQGHWYPEKPFKGSAFRCLKTGDPIDYVLERAARESGVPITDILENLPNELSVWVDPGEVSYRIGEKGAVKILYSEIHENQEDNTSADREVKKTFNRETKCFQPIDTVNSNMNNLSLSPKASPHSGSSPHSTSSTSPTYKGSPNPNAAGGSFMQRNHAPLTFTTATFAQTKFGSTKLKTSSKRANSSYRMSPTEFSNYIKHRALQQQLHHVHEPTATQKTNFGSLAPRSPAKTLSPNSLSLSLVQAADPFCFSSVAMGILPQFNSNRNLFDASYHSAVNEVYITRGNSKYSTCLEPREFYTLENHISKQKLPATAATLQKEQQVNGNNKNSNFEMACNDDDSITTTNATLSKKNYITNDAITMTMVGNEKTEQQLQIQQNTLTPITSTSVAASPAASLATTTNIVANSQGSNNSKLIDGLNLFYSNATGPYQQLLVAN